MKLLVVSDSHGCVEPMARAARLENPELVLHLGDHTADARALSERLPGIPIHAVAGNSFADLTGGERTSALLVLEGRRVFMTHGHRYHVKSGYGELLEAARAQGAELVLCGHTHVPALFCSGGIRLFNPGSVGRPADGRPTYGVVRIDARGVDCAVRPLPHGTAPGISEP